MDPPVTMATRPVRSKSFLTFTGEPSTHLPFSFSVRIVGIKWPQILAGMKFHECRSRGNNPTHWAGENIEDRAKVSSVCTAVIVSAEASTCSMELYRPS